MSASAFARIQDSAKSGAQLIQQENLIYEGAFRMPSSVSPLSADAFYDGGTALAFNPDRSSLFLVGHPWYQRSAEIGIPAIRRSDDIEGLAPATLLQPLTDPTEGRLTRISGSPGSKMIGGQLVYKGKLYVTGFTYYDVAGTQTASHFVRPLSLTVSGETNGPFKVGSLYPGYVYGYMGLVPPEWQAPLGGPALTGNCCNPGASVVSQGPALSVFNPADAGVINPIPSTPLLAYPLNKSKLGPGGDSMNPVYNLTTRITGVVFPSGTRSVLFFGRHGIGPYCYGEGDSCGDRADGSKGTHAYPYVHQIWAYDANELVRVKAGDRQMWDVQPYAYWSFSLPFDKVTSAHLIGGAAYDPATGRIFIAQKCADTNCWPIVHVFKIARAA